MADPSNFKSFILFFCCQKIITLKKFSETNFTLFFFSTKKLDFTLSSSRCSSWKIWRLHQRHCSSWKKSSSAILVVDNSIIVSQVISSALLSIPHPLLLLVCAHCELRLLLDSPLCSLNPSFGFLSFFQFSHYYCFFHHIISSSISPHRFINP